MKKWSTLLSGMMILLIIFAYISCKKVGEREEPVKSEIAMKMERYSPTKIDFDESILSTLAIIFVLDFHNNKAIS